MLTEWWRWRIGLDRHRDPIKYVNKQRRFINLKYLHLVADTNLAAAEDTVPALPELVGQLAVVFALRLGFQRPHLSSAQKELMPSWD